MTETNKNGKLIAIITMCFIFAMISFVTNMGAPFGNIWGFLHEFRGVSRRQWVGWGRTHLHLSDLLGQGESHGQEPKAVLLNHFYAPTQLRIVVFNL